MISDSKENYRIIEGAIDGKSNFKVFRKTVEERHHGFWFWRKTERVEIWRTVDIFGQTYYTGWGFPQDPPASFSTLNDARQFIKKLIKYGTPIVHNP